MKKSLIFLFAVAAIGISCQLGDGQRENVAYAASGGLNVASADSNRFQAEFSYEMAEITSKVVSSQATTVEAFKANFAYATAQVTAKVMPILPNDKRAAFAYSMAQITTKIMDDNNLDIKKAKIQFAYEVAQITAKVINGGNTVIIPRDSSFNNGGKYGNVAGNNSSIADNSGGKDAIPATGYVAPKTYSGLMKEIKNVGNRGKKLDNLHVEGDVRLHYADNSGAERWAKDSSGIRTYLGLDTEIYKDWRLYGMLESEIGIKNYNNDFKLSRLYVAGKLGEALINVGAFGYLMADGNIYDSRFMGVRGYFGDPVKFTVSYGETDDTSSTYVATARYEDFDYNLEAGVYSFRMKDDNTRRNTIVTLSGNYKFSNFRVGAMCLGSSRQDDKGEKNGYVLNLTYGDLATWKLNSYEIYAKYYNQPLYTYIAHGMNGLGANRAMQGFKGPAFGAHYTFAKNMVLGLEYYNLKDRITGERGKTLWSEITYYF